MSSGETVGLVLTAALLGAIFGAIVSAIAGVMREKFASRQRVREAYATWLTARKTHTRSSLSFVAAFRALANEDRSSDYFILRREEATRVRIVWCDAIRDLDHAESVLLTLVHSPDVCRSLRKLPRVSPQQLREAIDGAPKLVASLRRLALDLNDRATDLLMAQVQEPPKRPWRFGDMARQAATFAEKVVDRLGGPPT